MTTRDRNIDAGRATARVRHVKKGTHSARDTKAYWNILGFAKEQATPAEWADSGDRPPAEAVQWGADILAYLGLDGHTDCPPEPARLTAFEGVKSPGPRSPTATQFPEGGAS